MEKKYDKGKPKKVFCENCESYIPKSNYFPKGLCVSVLTYLTDPQIINKNNDCKFYEAKNES